MSWPACSVNQVPDEHWEAIEKLTHAVMDLASAFLPLVNDPKVLTRLKPFYEDLHELKTILGEHCRREPADADSSSAELLERLEGLEGREADREADRARPVHITFVDTRREKESETGDA
jgi:hypothetical protein